MFLKRVKNGISVCALMLLLTGCGWVKSPDALYRQAKNIHGDCTVVSKTKSNDFSQVVLHDTLQDFDYEVTSSMSDISIDGSSFGSVPGTSDSFEKRLRENTTAKAGSEITAICAAYGVNHEISTDEHMPQLISIYSDDEENAKKAALECARVIQNENKANRLDGTEIAAYKGEYDRYGSVKLPDISWRTAEDEKIDYYTKMARMQTDPNAVYVRTETGTFAQTGADLQRVVNALGTDFPTSDDSPVTFYYFTDTSGNEFYICDFNYYYDEYSEFKYYTNYKGR